MADVMEEVNEELRQQKLEAFWRENRNWIIGSILLAIATTAGITWWRSYTLQQNLKGTTELMKVSEEKDPRALTTFADSANTNHAVFARLLAAGLHVDQGNSARAIEIYNEIAGMRGLDRSLRDFARILSVTQRLNKDDAKSLHAELADLSSRKSPYRFTALELNAMVYAREGKLKEAAESLEAISTDAEAPQDARMRATTLHEFYAASSAPAGKPADKAAKKDSK